MQNKTPTHGLVTLALISLALQGGIANAKPKTKSLVPSIKPVEIKPTSENSLKTTTLQATPKNEAKSTSGNTKAWTAFLDLKKKYRAGQIDDDEMWAAIGKFAEEVPRQNKSQFSAILQVQATLLSRAKKPILSAIYAAQTLIESPDPLDDEYKRSWVILRDVSRKQPIQNLIDVVASNTTLGDKSAPAFGSDWNYFLANAKLKQKNQVEALALYRAVRPGDRYFLPAKFQEAMINLDQGDHQDTIKALRTISLSQQSANKKMTTEEYFAIQDHANMALGRVLYENRKFAESIKHYRLVRRDGAQFYDALFEQSWALFMAGYPNHALGTIYAVRSPFFKDTFNPEATMLSSIIYYWMCRYDDSRAELAEFMTKHQGAINDLNKYLARGITDPSSYYRLFEDTVSGVSSSGLGLPRELVSMAIQQDNLMFARDQYAAVVDETQKLDANGIFGRHERTEMARKYLEKWSNILKEDIGVRLHNEMKALKSEYERLYEQAQFLYVELLMSKKDQLLGKELHSDGKLANLSTNENIRGWSRKSQTWASDNKQEYWADELGFHIVRVQPLCIVKNQ